MGLVSIYHHMSTTIQISDGLQKELVRRKLFSKETYEEVIWDLIEDTLELSEGTKRDLIEARADIEAGRTYTLDEIKEEMGL